MGDYSDWLAHAADDLTPEQREEFDSTADAYYALPFHAQRDPEDAIADSAEDDAALTAILQRILGEDSLMSAAGRAWPAELDLQGCMRAESSAGTRARLIEELAGFARVTIRPRTRNGPPRVRDQPPT